MRKTPTLETRGAPDAGEEENLGRGDGAISRRTLIGGAAATIAAGAVFMTPMRAEAKVPQAAAKYQETPKDGHKCSGCQQFAAPDSCKLVDGKINPEGWCQFFSPKAG